MDSARPHPHDPLVETEFSRHHPTAARVLRRWRELTGGLQNPQTRDTERRTLIACSGGADSIALAAILSLVEPKPLVAHIVHDLRDPEHTTNDCNAAAQAAATLGCEFAERSIQVKVLPGNTEHNARTARYEALTQIATEHRIDYIATAHHADDQLETMLMNLLRGAGPRGLAGIHESRSLASCTLIRPMLAITHQDALDLCTLAKLDWSHDHTNDDVSLTRNKLRHQLVPLLKEFDPEIATKASTSANACRSTIDAIHHLVEQHLWPLAQHDQTSITWTRDQLRNQPHAALVELISMSIDSLTQSTGRDRLTAQSLCDTTRAITDPTTDPRQCRLGPIVISVTARNVCIQRAPE